MYIKKIKVKKMFQTKYQLSDMKFVGYDTIKKKEKKVSLERSPVRNTLQSST